MTAEVLTSFLCWNLPPPPSANLSVLGTPLSHSFPGRKANAKMGSRKCEFHLRLSHYLEMRPETPCGIEGSGSRGFLIPSSGSDILQMSMSSRGEGGARGKKKQQLKTMWPGHWSFSGMRATLAASDRNPTQMRVRKERTLYKNCGVSINPFTRIQLNFENPWDSNTTSSLCLLSLLTSASVLPSPAFLLLPLNFSLRLKQNKLPAVLKLQIIQPSNLKKKNTVLLF